MNPHIKALGKPQNATTAIKEFGNQDSLRATLQSSLFYSFLRAGYKDEESRKLVEIAIGPVHHALELAYAAYKLHIEAINVQPPKSWVEK